MEVCDTNPGERNAAKNPTFTNCISWIEKPIMFQILEIRLQALKGFYSFFVLSKEAACREFDMKLIIIFYGRVQKVNGACYGANERCYLLLVKNVVNWGVRKIKIISGSFLHSINLK